MSRLKEFLLEWQWILLVMACVVMAFFLLFMGEILMRSPGEVTPGVVTPTAIAVTAVLPPTASPASLPSPSPSPTNTAVPAPSQTPQLSPTPTAAPTEVLPTATLSPSPSPTLLPETYVVQLHDNLSRIAERFFGSQRCWRGLYVTNGAIIGGDPNLIFAGQRYQLIYPCGR